MRIVIVEDEEPALAQLRSLLETQLPEPRRLDAFEDVETAAEHLARFETDLLFLDLDLRDASGFAILDRLKQRAFHTVIVSGHIDQALKAFEYGVVDFIPKPANASALERAMTKIRNLESNSVRMIGVQSKSELRLLKIPDVIYIERKDNYAVYVCRDKSYRSRQSLAEILKGLPGQFRQAHKSFLVNLSHVEELQAESGGRYAAKLSNGETLPVGRSHYREIREALGL